jgi:hypothetical protein
VTTAIQQHQGASLATLDAATMQNLVAGGDCSRLTPSQKVSYYQARCEAAGLDPRAQPFAFMKLNGKEVLYALKAASDQLAAKHGVRMTIVSQATEADIRVVTVRAEAKDGRVTEEIGALPVKNLQGEALANALMKAVTKAKRRAVLSLCGLGMLDETEVDSIPQAQREPPPDAPRQTVNAEAVEVLRGPESGSRTAPPAEAARQTKPALPPAYVGALWARAKAELGTKAKAAFEEAGLKVFGATPKPAHEWTPEDAANVERVLFDVPF